MERGKILRRSFWDRPGYRVIPAGEKGPGILITSPPAEEVTAGYEAVRLSGRVAPGASLSINRKPVFIYPDGAFVELVPLEPGKNKIALLARDGEGESEYSIELERQEIIPDQPVWKDFDHPRLGRVILPHTPLQLLPGRTRILTLKKNSILKISGEGEEYFRVELTASLSGWVPKDNIEVGDSFPPLPFAISNVVVEGDKGRAFFRAQTSVPARVSYISPSELEIIFYNSIVDTEEINLGSWSGNCSWEQERDGEAVFRLRGPISCRRWSLGWEEGGYLLEWRDRPRKKDEVTVFIDPGHGGDEPGALSPIGIEEKEANLILARKVASDLKERGIRSVLSRDDDSTLGLYRRVELARKAGADILLSIHFNSLPEYEDPRGETGCTIFYYNPSSRRLAGIIHRKLLETGLSGNGVRWKSLAVIRPTDMIAVLIEVSYLTHPEDEARLLDADFREKVARAICESVVDYLE